MKLSKRAANYVDKIEQESGNITYIYSKEHIEKRNKGKMKRLKKLNKSLSKLRSQVRDDLKSEDPKTRYTALAVALIDETYERVGNPGSAKELKHYGVTTWLKKHFTFSKGKYKIKYVGKSGVKQEKEVSEKGTVSALKDLLKDKKDNHRIFEGDDFNITANAVNEYLKDFKISTKDIRGLHANEEMRAALKEVRKGKLPKDEKEKEKKLKEEFKEALEIASGNVGHEPATLKNQYLIPTIEPDYMKDGRIGTLANQEFRLSKYADEDGSWPRWEVSARFLEDGKFDESKFRASGLSTPYELIHEDGVSSAETFLSKREIQRSADFNIAKRIVDTNTSIEKGLVELRKKDYVFLDNPTYADDNFVDRISYITNRAKKLKKVAQEDPAKRTADSLYKIIEFAFYRVPPNERKRFLSRLRGKVVRINPTELSIKDNKPDSAISQSMAFAKGLLSGLNPAFVQRVLAELTQRLNTGIVGKTAAVKFPCQTPGAVFETKVEPEEIGVNVRLPEKWELNEEEAELVENELHNVVELVLSKHWPKKQRKAVVILGNPKYIDNEDAEKFYQEIGEYLENKGLEVQFDPGLPYTEPAPGAFLWIGHSRGVDRLRFAPKGTKTLAFGSKDKGAVNHPKDNNEPPPTKEHFIFTDEMKKAIDDMVENKKEAMFKLAKKKEKHTGAMLALMAPKEVIKVLKTVVDKDTVSTDGLHTTLLYLGKAKDLDKPTVEAIKRAVEKVCARHEPLRMRISGMGRFTKGKDGVPLYVVPNAYGLSHLQADLENVISNLIDFQPTHGWVPHMTIGYAADDHPELPQLDEFPEWTADKVRFQLAGEKAGEFVLGGKKKKAFLLSKQAAQIYGWWISPKGDVHEVPYDTGHASFFYDNFSLFSDGYKENPDDIKSAWKNSTKISAVKGLVGIQVPTSSKDDLLWQIQELLAKHFSDIYNKLTIIVEDHNHNNHSESPLRRFLSADKWSDLKKGKYAFLLSKRADENISYEEVVALANGNPIEFFHKKLHETYPKLGKLTAEILANNDPFNFFKYRIQEYYPDLGKIAAKNFAQKEPNQFLFFKLHIAYPEIGEQIAQNFAESNPTDFFSLELEQVYPEMAQIAKDKIEELKASPIEYNVFFGKLEKRYLPNQGEIGNWVHVVNVDIDDLSKFINKMTNLNAEIAASDSEDLLFHTRNRFLALSFYGPAVAVFNRDVYSEIDDIGRRYVGNITGAERTEAWINPSKLKLTSVITDVPEYAKEAKRLGITTVFTSPEALIAPAIEKKRPDYSEEFYRRWKVNSPKLDEEDNYMKRSRELGYEEYVDDKAVLSSKKLKLSKRANDLQPIAPSPNIVVEPYEPQVQKAVQKIKSMDPSIFNNITKIVVHPGMSAGQLGHVEMGPGKDPREIHLFRDRIQQIVKQQMGAQTDPKALEEATERAIMEVITHEIGHIGRSRTQEQILQQPFFDESAAERQSQEFMGRVSEQTFNLSKRAVPLRELVPNTEDYWVKILNVGVSTKEELLEKIKRLAVYDKVSFTNHAIDRLTNREGAEDLSKRDVLHSLKNVNYVRPSTNNNVVAYGPDKNDNLIGSVVNFDKHNIVVISTNFFPNNIMNADEQESNQRINLLEMFPPEKVGPDWQLKQDSPYLIMYKRQDGVRFILASLFNGEVQGHISWPKKWGQLVEEAEFSGVGYRLKFTFDPKKLPNPLQFIELLIPTKNDFPLSYREQNTMDHEEQVLPFLQKVPKLRNVIAPTPSDKPFQTTLPGYEHWHGEIGNNPQGLFSIPSGIGGGGR